MKYTTLTIKSNEKEVFDFFNQLKNRYVYQGSGKYKQTGKIIDVEMMNGNKTSNTGVFVWFLEDGETLAQKIKVNFSDQNRFVEI